MTVFLDSNIILDILLKNEDFWEESKAVLSLADSPEIDFFVSAASVTDIFYIVNKKLKDFDKSKAYLQELLEIISIAGVDEFCIKNALLSSWQDFEDAVQHEASVQIRADYLVTRNTKDFPTAFVQVITPKEFLARIGRK